MEIFKNPERWTPDPTLPDPLPPSPAPTPNSRTRKKWPFFGANSLDDNQNDRYIFMSKSTDSAAVRPPRHPKNQNPNCAWPSRVTKTVARSDAVLRRPCAIWMPILWGPGGEGRGGIWFN